MTTNTTTITTTISLPAYVVRDEKGSVDQLKTLDKFIEDLGRYCAAAETETGVLAEKVKQVFDRFKGTNLNMPALVSLTTSELNVAPEHFKIMSEKVMDYIRTNSGERGEAMFSIAKGKGGGVRRWSDTPLSEKEVAAAKAAAEVAAKAAAAKPVELSTAASEESASANDQAHDASQDESAQPSA